MSKLGTNTGSVEYSPDRIRRMERAKLNQEKKWAKKCGPVTIRKATPEEMKRKKRPASR